ncbi:hypothetical protein JCM3765_004106 [Sporobolomyces pararoseus]
MTSSRLPLTNISLFPPSSPSNPTSSTLSTSRTQPRKSIIKLRVDEWGSLATTATNASTEEERDLECGRKRGGPPLTSTQGARDPLETIVTAKNNSGEEAEEEESSFRERAGKQETVQLNLDKPRPPSSPRNTLPPETSPRGSSVPLLPRHPNPQASNGLPSSSLADPQNFTSDPPSRSRWESFKAIHTALTSPLKVLQANVPIQEYETFLLPSSTVEPHLSLEILELQVQFFMTIQDPRMWAERPESALYKSLGLPYPNEDRLATRLDLGKIRTICPLKRSKWDFRFDFEDLKNFHALRATLDWMYGLSLERREILSFLENAPLPLLVLGELHTLTRFPKVVRYSESLFFTTARLHADKARHTKAVEYSALQLHSYLLSTRSKQLDPHQQRGKDLFIWLTASDGGMRSQRWRRFWVEEVERKREGKRSLTDRWIETDGGWTGVDSLLRWEETKST